MLLTMIDATSGLVLRNTIGERAAQLASWAAGVRWRVVVELRAIGGQPWVVAGVK